MPTVLSQTLACSDFEVLVVENGPAAGARNVVAKASVNAFGPRLRYVHEPTPGLLSGRHRGALEALGEVLVFADDDIDASPGWLSAILDAFSDSSVQIVGGPSLPHFEQPPPAWLERYWYVPPYGGRACTNLSLLDLGDTPLRIDANYVWGLNFAIRREVLVDLGGFHPDSLPDHLQHFQGDGETGLTRKANTAGLTAHYQPEARVCHRIATSRLTVEYFRRRAVYQGVCDSFTAIRRDPSCLVESASTDPTVSEDAPAPLAESDLFKDIDRSVQAAYRAGFAFHQNAARLHPRLLEWVLRKDYWDYSLPDLELQPSIASGVQR